MTGQPQFIGGCFTGVRGFLGCLLPLRGGSTMARGDCDILHGSFPVLLRRFLRRRDQEKQHMNGNINAHHGNNKGTLTNLTTTNSSKRVQRLLPSLYRRPKHINTTNRVRSKYPKVGTTPSINILFYRYSSSQSIRRPQSHRRIRIESKKVRRCTRNALTLRITNGIRNTRTVNNTTTRATRRQSMKYLSSNVTSNLL